MARASLRTLVISLVSFFGASAHAGPSTAFTFTGMLPQSGGGSGGPVAMSFTLWDSVVNGDQLGQTVICDGSDGNLQPVNVTERGGFAVTLDFGVPVWGTQSRYVEVTANGELQQPRFIITGSTFSANTRGIVVTTGGGVGIGTNNPGNFLLAVNGPAANRTGSWSTLSDARLKRDVRDLAPGTLERLLTLRGVEFEYTDEAQEQKNVAAGPMVGFLAQDVECIFPEWVECDGDGMRFVTERGTTALFVEALRELRKEKDDQIAALEAAHKAELDKLAREKDEQVSKLERRLERLEQSLNR